MHYLKLCNNQVLRSGPHVDFVQNITFLLFHILHHVDVLYNTRERSTRMQTIFGKGDQSRLLVLVCLDQFLPWTKFYMIGQSEEIGS